MVEELPLQYRVSDEEDFYMILDEALGRLEAGQSEEHTTRKVHEMCLLPWEDARVIVNVALKILEKRTLR